METIGLSYLTALLGVSLIWWVVLFLGFLFGFKEEVDTSSYFRKMFEGFRSSELRGLWKSIILGIEYVLGLYALVIVKSSWHPAKWIRITIGKIFFK